MRSRPQCDESLRERMPRAMVQRRPSADAANGNDDWNLPIYSPINGRVLRVFQESRRW